MQNWEVILLVAAAIVVVAIVGWVIYDRRRSTRLQTRFGPEYDRAVAGYGSRRRAEAELVRRELHAKRLRDRRLNPADRDRFIEEWQLCQERFVDDPAGAVEDADNLLIDVMRTRGYKVDSTYDRMMDMSAAYPQYAESYREAGEILVRHRHGGEASTDALRQAFLHYKTLFDELLGVPHEESKRAA
jgi:hypothetical protein